MPRTVYLVDASTFIHRSYHAIRGLATKNGRPTNAVYGFVATLQKLLREKEPSYVGVFYDSKGPSFRRELYEEYKANRPTMPEDLQVQQEPIRKVVEALGLKSWEAEGIEADDLIAAAAMKALEAGDQVVIVSSDKDFYQLLSDRVTMYDPNPQKESSMTPEELKDKYGVSPSGFLEMQGLMGDSTDNIPGVPGVGEKTAAKLISQFETLENLYDRLEEVPGEKLRAKLKEHRDSAFLSRRLAGLRTDLPLALAPENLALDKPDPKKLREIYQDLEFSRFLADLDPVRTISYDDYHLIQSEQDLSNLLQELAGISRLSVDLETTSLDPARAEIVGISLCAKPGRSFYLPLGHQNLDARNLELNKTLDLLGQWLENDQIEKIGQNFKYDFLILLRHGVRPGPVGGDPMIASYLLNPGAAGHGLNQLSLDYLNHDPIKYDDVVGRKGRGFEEISPEEAREYACEDADLALRLDDLLREKIEEMGLTALYRNLELPLIEVLAEMEMTGIRLDLELLKDLSTEFELKMQGIEQNIYKLAGREFNINSPKQLGEVLFEDLGLPQGKKTRKKTGYSTDVEVLTELAVNHELPAEVLNYRTLSKLKSTYVDALSELVNPATGRVHTNFNQAVAATGRLSSSDPNLQNIPIRTEEGRRLREAFITDSGWKILAADYSQIELRILAHYSRDDVLQDAFRRSEDIHTRTAAEVFGVMPGLVDSRMRREAKTINFGIVYGQQAFGLAKQLGIEKKQAQEYIDNYFERYSGVKEYMDETIAQARQNGYVTTLLGRRRPLPEINAKNYQTRSMAERMAINTPIQGTAADLIKKAMIEVRKSLQEAGFKTRMLLQVHDELVFEAPENEAERAAELIRRAMENVFVLDVPLVVDIALGNNWAEAH